MRRRRATVLLLLALPGASRLLAQDAGELARTLCDDADPKRNCPGERCACVDETLEITFDGVSQSVLELPGYVPESAFEATVVMDVKSPTVQGWSYGVEHDGEVLQILDAGPWGTDAEIAYSACICPPEVFQWAEGIETCKDDPDPACPDPRPGTGFVSAVILSFIQPLTLEVRRNTLGRAIYRLARDPGPEGTVIQFVGHLQRRGGRVGINITEDGRSRLPRLLIDGLVRRPEQPFRRGDLDGSGRISIADVVGLLQAAVGGRAPPLDCLDLLDVDDDGRRTVTDAIPLLQYVFQRGPAPPEPFLACGLDPTAQDALGCAQGSCR